MWQIVEITSGKTIVTSGFNDGTDPNSVYNDIYGDWRASGSVNPYHDLNNNSTISNIVISEPATYSFKVNSVDSGIITAITINNGGKNFVADAVFTSPG